MAEPEFHNYMQARQMLKNKLEKTGISEDEYLELFDLLDTVTNVDLGMMRDEQFRDDAWDLAVSIQSATEKKRQIVSAHLRKFAEHVVRHACNIEDIGKIHDLVDRLPQMSSQEQNETAL